LSVPVKLDIKRAGIYRKISRTGFKERIVYLRKNPKAGKDGSKIEYYQIAHNHRDPGTKKSKCTIVRGIGRVDNPEVREALLGLCITIAQ